MNLSQDTIFVIGLVSAGFVGGIATLLGAHSVEKFGGVVGGIAGTIPLTIIPFMMGILLFESPDRVDLTLDMVPVGMLGTLVVLLLWRFLPPHLPRRFTSTQRLFIMVSVSLLTFAILGSGFIVILSLVVTKNMIPNQEGTFFMISGFTALAIYIFLAFVFVWFPNLPVGRKGDEKVTWSHYLGRFLVGCIITAVSVVIARYSIYGGGVSIAFPAVSLTALASLWSLHGDTVAMSSASPMLVGSASHSIFALIFSWMSPILDLEYGKVLGTTVCFAATWFFVILFYSIPAVFVLRTKELSAVASVERMILPEDFTFTSDDQTDLLVETRIN